MSELVESKGLGDYLYRAYIDYNYQIDIDFENEQEKQYLSDYYYGKFSFYSCTTSKICKCCEQYKEIDCLSGIDAKDGKEALEYYIEEYGVKQ